jgi:parallel beta-helix repeat protein
MKKNRSHGRRLRMESLEGREMLAVLVVDAAGHGDFTTIQAAVDAADAGDKIRVRAGTYAENVVVDKELTIRGAAGNTAIVDPVNNTTTGALGIGFDLQASGIKIKGFTIRESGTNVDTEGTIGIRTSASFAGYEIENNVIEDHTIGIYLNTETSMSGEVDETEVEGNTIRDNNRGGANTGNGIFSDQGLQNVEIERNTFTGANATASIKIIGTDGETDTVQSEITIKWNNFQGLSGAGIYFENVVDSVVKRNVMMNVARTGIHLNGGNENVEVKRNRLTNPGTQDLYGILLSDTEEIGANTNNLIKRNRITGAGLTGIQIEDSSSNTLLRNKIKGSLGGDLEEDADGNGISLVNADNNTLERNKTKENARHGIFVDADSTGNTLIRNKSEDNNVEDADGFDYNDDTTGGTGPSGVQNTYTNNKGDTENKAGLIED